MKTVIQMKFPLFGTASLLLIALGSPAYAGDGALEISQTCVATGCFPGDTAGFPVQTQSDARYVLTSSLVLPNANTDGVVLATGATLDLNGFAITGPYQCTGVPPVCTGTGNGFGVMLNAGATLRNGAVRGMLIGVDIQGRSVTVENVVIEGNDNQGIGGGGEGMIVRGCHVSRNGGSGILMSGADGASITGNVVMQNAGYGINMSATGASILGNTIVDNTNSGILTSASNGYAQNVLSGNAGGAAQVQNITPIGTNLCGNDAVCP